MCLLKIFYRRRFKILVNQSNSNRFSDTKLIGKDGKLIGDMNVENALKIANKQNLDLVMVNKNGKIPICKLMDYGKYCYNKEKEAQRKNKKPPKEKEFHVRPSTQIHDVDIAIKKAMSHIEKRNHVSFYMDIPPREADMKEKIQDKVKYIISEMSEIAKIDKKSKNNRCIMVHFVPKAEE